MEPSARNGATQRSGNSNAVMAEIIRNGIPKGNPTQLAAKRAKQIALEQRCMSEEASMSTEDDLRTAILDEGAPTVGGVRPGDQTEPTAPRRRHLLLPLGAIVAVVVISLGTFAATRGVRSGPAANRPSTTQVPANLADIGWVGISLQKVGGATEPPMSSLLMRTNGNFQAGLGRCNGLLGTATFDQKTARLDSTMSVYPCPATTNPSDDQSDLPRESLLESILSGTVQWKLDGNQLTITKEGIGTITYVSGPSDPPSSDGGA
jgi:heat shock protein HslJ